MLDEKPPAAKLANADTDIQNECTQYVRITALIIFVACGRCLIIFEARKAAPDIFGVVIHVTVVLDPIFTNTEFYLCI